eukprot:sb/3461713/
MNWLPASNSSQLNQKVTRIVNSVQEAVKKASKRVYGRNPKNPWFTKKIRIMRDEFRKKEDIYLEGNNDPEFLEDFKRTKSSYGDLLNEEKTSSWRQWCSTGGKEKMAGLLKQKEKENDGSFPPIQINGAPPINNKECLEHIVDHLVGGTETQDNGPEYVPGPGTWEETVNKTRVAETIFTKERVRKAMASTKNLNSAPGPDMIKWRVLNAILPVAEEAILSIFKDCVMLETLPAEWLKTRGVLLTKPGRDKTLPTGYRTVTLASTLFKLMEKTAILHLSMDKSIYSKIHPLQFGFTPGRGTDQAISALVTKIEGALHKREIAACIFLDIKGAFDQVNKSQLIKSLGEHGCPKEICNIFRTFLDHRILSVTKGDTTVTRSKLKGGSQGTSGMPLMWNTTTTPILQRVNMVEYLQALADDFAGLVSGSDVEDLMKRLQWIMDEVAKWCEELDLEVSVEKSAVVLFTHKKHMPPSPTAVTYKGETIPFEKEYKYLGVTLDNKLNWTSHYKRITAEASRTENLARRLVGPTWGLGTEVQEWIWTAVTTAKLLYGVGVTISGTSTKLNLNKLDSIYYDASKRLLRCSDKAPKYIVCGIAGLEHPISAAKRRATVSQAKIPGNKEPMSKGKWRGHTTYLQEEVENATSGHKLDIIQPKYKAQDYTVAIPPTTIHPETERKWKIFSDGSDLGEGRVGAGWIIMKDDIEVSQGQKKLHSKSTINQAETEAMKGGVEDLLKLAEEGDTAIAFTDSQVVIQQISTAPTRHKTTELLIDTLNKLSEICTVEISWCRGHTGIYGNERADYLAKLAAAEEAPDPENHLLAVSHVKTQAKKAAIDNGRQQLARMERELKSTNKMLGYIRERITENKKDTIPTPQCVNFLTNRGEMRVFKHKRGIAASPNCRFCNLEVEDNVHILCTCPAIVNIRAKYLQANYLHPGYVKTCNWEQLDSFLSGCGVMKESYDC